MDTANYYFACKAVSPNEDSLHKFIRVMTELDDEIIPCCIENVFIDPMVTIEPDELFSTTLYGLTRGRIMDCVTSTEHQHKRNLIGYRIGKNGMWDLTQPVYSKGEYFNLIEICDKLDLYMEIYAQNQENTEQEHIFVDPEGRYTYDLGEPAVAIEKAIKTELFGKSFESEEETIIAIRSAFAFNEANYIYTALDGSAE